MSKGPGNIERQLLAIFEKNRQGFFSTKQLCRKVYRERLVEKKHRVSVLRALDRMSTWSMPHLWRLVIKGDRDDVWFDYRGWPHPNDPPPNGAPAKNKRPRKKRRLYFRGRLYEHPPKR